MASDKPGRDQLVGFEVTLADADTGFGPGPGGKGGLPLHVPLRCGESDAEVHYTT